MASPLDVASPTPNTGGADGEGGNRGSCDAGSMDVAKSRPPKVVRTAQEIVDSVEAKRHSCHMKHLEGLGRQIASSRATAPSISFGGSETVPRERCIEIVQHPNTKNPGPLDYRIPEERAPSIILKGWSDEERFQGEKLTLERTGANIIRECYSTQASPFSSTYPYNDVKPGSGNVESVSEALEGSGSADHQSEQPAASSAAAAPPSPPSPTSPRAAKSQVGIAATAASATSGPAFMRLVREQESAVRRKANVLPDHNALYFKQNVPPAWAFGCSGLGHRFRVGTQFSRPPAVPTNSRQKLFRALRDEV